MPKETSHVDRHPLHRVVALVDQDSNPFELACMIEVLGNPRPGHSRRLYDFRLCARTPSVVMREQHFTLTGVADLSALEEADTVIVPNRPEPALPHHPDLLRAIVRAADRGARLVAMCTGAFTLAEAGVLDGRRATVHWMWADAFRRSHPAVAVDEDVLFVDDGTILTAAGSAAALDLALHIVRQDHGADVAATVARRLVFSANRSGGQRQFIDRPVPSDTGPALAATLAWAEARATEAIGVADLASHAAMSPATLHRHFRSELGHTPLAWLTSIRVQHARRLLETTSLPVEQVARASGLGTSANLRVRLRAETGLSPSDYRRSFRRTAVSSLRS